MGRALRKDSSLKYTTLVNEQQFEVEIQRDGSVLVNGKRYDVDFLELGSALFSIIRDTESKELAIDGNQGEYELVLDGRLYEARVLDPRSMLMLNRRGGLQLDSGELHAPMPGLIVEVTAQPGDAVEKGQTVIILESMKMQNELKAPSAGTIQSINTEAGVTVDKGQLLLTISQADPE